MNQPYGDITNSSNESEEEIDFEEYIKQSFGIDLNDLIEDNVFESDDERIDEGELLSMVYESWRVLDTSISKQERTIATYQFTFQFINGFERGFDIGHLINNSHISINSVVKKLSFQYVEQFCDLFSKQATVTSMKEFDVGSIIPSRAIHFFFDQINTTDHKNTMNPCSSRAMMILKTICILLELDSNLKVTKGFATALLLSIKLLTGWIGLESPISERDDVCKYSILPETYNKFIRDFNVGWKSDEHFGSELKCVKDFKLTVEDKNPCIVLVSLFRQISTSPETFSEIFVESSLWRYILDSLIDLKESSKCDWKLYIQYADLVSAAFKSIFDSASLHILRLHEICIEKVTTHMLETISNVLDECRTDVIRSEQTLHRILMRRLTLVNILEICTYSLFTSLHVIPGLFLEFEQNEGYDTMKKLFKYVTNHTLSSTHTLNNNMIMQLQQEKMLSILRVLQCLVIDFVKFVQHTGFVTDGTSIVQRKDADSSSSVITAANEDISEVEKVKWKHNKHVFLLILKLFKHTTMEEEFDLEGEEIDFRSKFCCKRELLMQIVELLRGFPTEYVRDLNEGDPFSLLCHNFTSINHQMQWTVLDLYQMYMKLFCRYVSINYPRDKKQTDSQSKLRQLLSFKRTKEKETEKRRIEDDPVVRLLCRDFYEYCKLFEYQHSSPQSVSRVCAHTKKILSTSELVDEDAKYLTKENVQYMFRLAGLPHLLLKTLNTDSSIRNTMLSCEMLDILFLYLYKSAENHKDFIEAGGLFKFGASSHQLIPVKPLEILYMLLYDADLIEQALKIIHHVVTTDEEQKWSFIVADIISILGSREENCEKYRGTFTLRMCNLILISFRHMLVDNPNTKESFRASGGFECMIKLLQHLSTIFNDENYDMVFAVVQSIILLITFAIENNYLNQHYFSSSIKFSSMLAPLHEMKFIQSVKHGIFLCMNLLQLSIMRTDLLNLELPDQEQIISNFELIVQRDPMLFFNPELIPELLLKLFASNLEQIDLRLSTFFFECLLRMNLRFTANCHRLSNKGTMKVLLEEFASVMMNQTHDLQSTLVDNFLVLARHNFSVSEMQEYLSLIHPNDYAPIFPDNVLEALLQLSTVAFCPSHYIDFPCFPNRNPYSIVEHVPTTQSTEPIVKRSAVLLPQIAYTPWPPVKGYSITCWFNIEQFMEVSSNTEEAEAICLFSLSSRYREMLVDAIVTADKHFAIRMFTEVVPDIVDGDSPHNQKPIKSIQTKKFENYQFQTHAWYSITLTHNQTILKEKIKDSFVLYVNGVHVDSITIEHVDSSYLRVLKNVLRVSGTVLQNISLGLSVEDVRLKKDDKPVRSFSSILNTPIKTRKSKSLSRVNPAFQLGNVCMLEGTLTETEVYMIYYLGPNYAGTFDEDMVQYFPNEIINETSVKAFPKNVYYMRECSNNFGLSHLSERLLFLFSARDATFVTRTVARKKDSVATPDSTGTPNLEDKEVDHQDVKTKIINQNIEPYLPNDSSDVLKLSKSIVEFTAMPALITGSAEIVSRLSFKTNLFTVGGMETILGLLCKLDDLYAGVYEEKKLKRQRHKVIILQIIARLLRYDACNTYEMLSIEGYDLLNHVLLQRDFEIDDAILCAVFSMCGLDISPEQISSLSLHPIARSDPQQRHAQLAKLTSRGIVSNYVAFEKLILDYRIWSQASLHTQKNMMDMISLLVSYENPNAMHHINMSITVSIMKRLLFTLQQNYLQKKPWPRELIRPLVNVFRFVMPAPLSVTYLFPLCQYLILTHPERGLTVRNIQASEPEYDLSESRNAIFQLFYSFMRQGSEDVLEDVHIFLPISQVIALLGNESDITRSHLLNILGVYITRRVNLREHFKKINGVHLMTQQLLQYSPSLVEFQILFDLLLGNFYQAVKPEPQSHPIDSPPPSPTHVEIAESSSHQRTLSKEVLINNANELAASMDEADDSVARVRKRLSFEDIPLSLPKDSSIEELAISSPRKRAVSGIISWNESEEVEDKPEPTNKIRRSKSLKFPDTTNTSRKKRGPLKKELFVSPVENLTFPDFLYPIFKLIPVIKSPVEKVNVLRSLALLFNQGSSTVRKQFIDINAHMFLRSFLTRDVVLDDADFMASVLEFLVSYLTHVLFDSTHGRNGVDVLADVMQSLLIAEGSYSVWFVHNFQRYILHGILINFQTHHFFVNDTIKDKKQRKLRDWMDTQFARFSACATDYVTQWFDLPPQPPHPADADMSYEDVKRALQNYKVPLQEMASPSVSEIQPEQQFEDDVPVQKIEVINNYMGRGSLIRQKQILVLPSLKLSASDMHAKDQLTSSIWYEFEHRILGKYESLPSKMFQYSYLDIAGFTYWLIDSIRVCLKNRTAKKVFSTTIDFFLNFTATELVLIDQVKKMILFLSDEKRSSEDIIFVLLNILYFFPLGSSATFKNILNGQVPTSSETFADMVISGKIIQDYASDQQFITRLIYNTSKLFSRENPLLVQLNQRVWKHVLETRKAYLKSIFQPDKIDPMHPDFISIIQEVSTVVSQKDFSQFILNPNVIIQVKEWDTRDFSRYNDQMNKRTLGFMEEEKNQKKLDQDCASDLKTESMILETFQLKFLRPVYMKMRKLVDRDLVSMKRWNKLIKVLSDERSVLNICFYTRQRAQIPSKTLSTMTTVNDHLYQSNDYHTIQFRAYDDCSFDLSFWKLDPTAGPNRIRMRLKKHAKHEIYNHIESNSAKLQDLLKVQNAPSSDSPEDSSSGEDLNQMAEKYEEEGDSLLEKLQNEQTEEAISYGLFRRRREQTFENHHHPGTSEKLLMEPKQCTRVTPLRKCEGELLLGENNIYFIGKEFRSHGPSQFADMISSSKALSQSRQYCFSYELIREIHKRRYLLRNTAMEIFLTNGKSLFLAFDMVKDRDDVHSLLMTPSKVKLSHLSLPNLVNYEEEVNGKFILQKSITQKWQEGLISNFEYLMHLNTLAGRSFNDLTQYPVFPHVIADYKSKELDLTNEKTFRDLSKPMGALKESRLEKAIMQFEHLKEMDEDNPPYHWGSHYSTPVSVLYYLVRLEPFSRCFWELNGQKLDIADRTFHSIMKSWQLSSGGSKSDVKELIPEFFYLPEFLQNRNRIDFGTMQNETRSDDVELPPWAKNNAIIFVRKQRQALESDYVSANLHKWIDLIFGYKQRGESAISAHNVFHYMTYEGRAEEVEAIDDPVLREARWAQICNFGQTPKQLFKRPHPEKYVYKSKVPLLQQSALSSASLSSLTPRTSISNLPISPESAMSVATQDFSEILSPRTPRTPLPSFSDNSPRTVSRSSSSDNFASSEERRIDLNHPHANKIYHSPQYLAPSNVRFFKEAVGDLYIVDDITSYSTNSVAAVGKNKLFIPQQGQERKKSPVYLSYQHWDQTLRVCKWETEKTLHTFNFMMQPEKYLCSKFGYDGKTLALGTNTCVIHMFRLNPQFRVFKKKKNTKSNVRRKKNAIVDQSSGSDASDSSSRYIDHVATLSGHSDRVISVYISSEFSIILSGSDDHTMMIWDLNRLSYIRSTLHGGPVYSLTMSKTNGDIASACTNAIDGKHCLYLWTVNGDLIHGRHMKHPISCMTFSNVEEGIQSNVIVAGLTNGTIVVMDAIDLKIFTKLKISDYNSRITSIAINPSMTEVVTGNEDGVVVTWNIQKRRR